MALSDTPNNFFEMRMREGEQGSLVPSTLFFF